MKTVTISKFAIPLLLSLQTFYSWDCFYESRFLEYDDNIGLMIDGFLLSLASVVVLIAIRFFRKDWIKANKLAIIIWLIIGSPITIILLAIFYSDIFGTPNG
jgi:EamA domain-containing membrane protein RarD